MAEKVEKVSQHFRMPADVIASAKAQAGAEHRTFTDAMVRLARAYGQGDPAALAIVAGVSPAVLEIHARTVTPARASRARQAGPAAAALARDRAEDQRADSCPPHPPGRVHKGLCGACGQPAG